MSGEGVPPTDSLHSAQNAAAQPGEPADISENVKRRADHEACVGDLEGADDAAVSWP